MWLFFRGRKGGGVQAVTVMTGEVQMVEGGSGGRRRCERWLLQTQMELAQASGVLVRSSHALEDNS
jgi:hypothetical protein